MKLKSHFSNFKAPSLTASKQASRREREREREAAVALVAEKAAKAPAPEDCFLFSSLLPPDDKLQNNPCLPPTPVLHLPVVLLCGSNVAASSSEAPMSSWSALSQAHRRRSGAVLQEKPSFNLLTLCHTYSLPNPTLVILFTPWLHRLLPLLTAAAHEEPSRPIPTVLSHHHQKSPSRCVSFIGVVVVNDVLVALICRKVVVLREKL